MELLTLSVFCIILLGTIAIGGSLIHALLVGLVLFLLYGIYVAKVSPLALAQMVIDGVLAAKNILLTFGLIGILTVFWRASGTIPTLVTYASTWIQPNVVLLLTFVLNGLVSFLMGSSFATSATMGVICMTMANGMGVDPLLAGGAMLSGVYFGDRCSPVSTSALLVSELTHTDLYENIKQMFHTAWIPCLLSCLFYGIWGWYGKQENVGDLTGVSVLADSFTISWPMLLPAMTILVMGFFHVPVKKTMAVSILLSGVCAVYFQQVEAVDLLTMAIWGFHTEQAELETLLGGGGLISMARVAAIVCISSSYAGIFHGTGMLRQLEQAIQGLSERMGNFGAMVVTSVFNSAVACNQTLAIMLTHELCQKLTMDKTKRAIALENSVVVIAPLIPWSIAGAVPLEAIGAPLAAIPFAVYLWVLPAWQLIKAVRSEK